MSTSGNREMESFLRKVLAHIQCPVCMQYMMPPIPMCQNGHNICNTCRQKVERCPMCTQKFLESRCWLLENILHEVKYPCQYYKEGCQYASAPEQIELHQTSCPHRPFNCPYSVVTIKSCCWKSHISAMPRHIECNHNSLLRVQKPLNSCCMKLDCAGSFPSYKALYILDETFFVVSNVINMDLYCCILYVGPEEKASCYNYTVTVKRGGSVSATVCLPTKSYLTDVGTIFRNQDCAVFSYMMWKQSGYSKVSCGVQIRNT